ncbi:MAG: hypothetical protein AABY27_01300 [Pseudomonadota bacterium]
MKKQKERFFNEITGKEYFLDEYEQELEYNFELQGSYPPEETKRKIAELVDVAKSHVEARTHIGLDMPTRDLDIVKYRASKLGISYKEIINMVVHKYASSPQEKILV